MNNIYFLNEYGDEVGVPFDSFTYNGVKYFANAKKQDEDQGEDEDELCVFPITEWDARSYDKTEGYKLNEIGENDANYYPDDKHGWIPDYSWFEIEDTDTGEMVEHTIITYTTDESGEFYNGYLTDNVSLLPTSDHVTIYTRFAKTDCQEHIVEGTLWFGY